MAQTTDYSFLSQVVLENISTDANKLNFSNPNGWSLIATSDGLAGTASDIGFAAMAFKKGSEVVIAYAGTEFRLNASSAADVITDLALAVGAPDKQAVDAAKFYLRVLQQVRASDPAATIAFTGHSLGGGLASLMSILFDVNAVVFSPAPFKNSARLLPGTPTVPSQPEVFQGVSTYIYDQLKRGAYADNDLAKLRIYAESVPSIERLPDSYYQRIGRISSFLVENDLVGISPVRNPLGLRLTDAILASGAEEVLSLGNSALSSWERHSGNMYALLFEEDEALLELSPKLPKLWPVISDGSLYGEERWSTRRDFRNHLLRHQYGYDSVDGPTKSISKGPLLSHFIADLEKLEANSGAGWLSRTGDLNAAVIAAAVEHYWIQRSYKSEIFTALPDALQFSLSSVYEYLRTDPAREIDQSKALPKLMAALASAAELSELDVRSVLANNLTALWWIGGQDTLTVNGSVDSDVVLGAAGVNTLLGAGGRDLLVGNSQADTLDGGVLGDLLIGRGGIDTLKGGEGDDVLFGGTEGDILEGGRGGDRLEGGAGEDTYKLSAGDGIDTIIDEGGQGKVEFDGVELTGGQLESGSTDTWIQDLSADGTRRIVYRRSGADLLVSLPGPAATNQSGSVRIKDFNFTAGSLGITLLNNPAPGRFVDVFYDSRPNNPFGFSPEGIPVAAPWQAIHGLEGGDEFGVVHDNTIIYGGDDNDLVKVSGYRPPEAGGGIFNDYTNIRLYGDRGNDYIQGGSGSDVIFGGDQDDWLMGQSVQDLLTPTAFDDGGDYLDGGAGNDVLTGGVGADVLKGGAGNDLIFGGGLLHPILNGNNPKDFFEGTGAQQWIVSNGDLQYSLPGISGFASLLLDQGNVIEGDDGSDYLIGGVAADSISGGSGRDLLIGLAGDDRAEGGDGNDILSGDGTQGLFILGGQSIHALTSEHGNDQLIGGAGNDQPTTWQRCAVANIRKDAMHIFARAANDAANQRVA